jgi:hypothetical protein
MSKSMSYPHIHINSQKEERKKKQKRKKKNLLQLLLFRLPFIMRQHEVSIPKSINKI